MAKICLDYGHGGNDPGAVYKGRKESDDNLSLGMAVATELRRHGVEVSETRTTDRAVSLAERSSLANKDGCDYFISFIETLFSRNRPREWRLLSILPPAQSLFNWRRRYRRPWWGSVL